MRSQTDLLEIPLPSKTARAAFAPLILFCVAHFFIDLYSIALGVMQPLLVDRFGLSLTQAGLLGGMLVFSSSLLQPVYGLLSDRFHTRLFTVLAPAMAAVFISSLGLAPGYRALMVMVWLGGAGIASFHPQATANATVGVDMNRGRAMAIFISAGTFGLAVGPAYFSLVTERVGLERTWMAAAPGVLVTLLLAGFLRISAEPAHPSAEAAHAKTRFSLAPLRAVWRQITLLYFLVFLRSVVQITFSQFLPLYLHLQRGYTLRAASYITSAYLLGGALGGFLGGNLADRFGGRRVILISMIGSVPLLLVFVHTTGLA
ncbi:MAG: MFS transporter [Acidobacteria bacterium]|nr:MFS transporter [Acidobacteriota bacterium]